MVEVGDTVHILVSSWNILNWSTGFIVKICQDDDATYVCALKDYECDVFAKKEIFEYDMNVRLVLIEKRNKIFAR